MVLAMVRVFGIATGSRGVRGLFCLIEKNFLDVFLEDTGDLKSQREAGIIAAILDGVDASTRDLSVHGKLCLRPFFFSSEDAQASFHSSYPRRQCCCQEE